MLVGLMLLRGSVDQAAFWTGKENGNRRSLGQSDVLLAQSLPVSLLMKCNWVHAGQTMPS